MFGLRRQTFGFFVRPVGLLDVRRDLSCAVVRRNDIDSSEFPVNPAWTDRQALLRKMRSIYKGHYNESILAKNGLTLNDMEMFDKNWRVPSDEAKQYWNNNLRRLDEVSWRSSPVPSDDKSPSWLEKLFSPHTHLENQNRIEQLYRYFTHLIDSPRTVSATNSDFYHDELFKYGQALKSASNVSFTGSRLFEFCEKYIMLNEITSHSQIVLKRSEKLNKVDPYELPGGILNHSQNFAYMMSALQNWYDVLPEPKLQHISPQDFGFITGSINRLLVADISKLDPQLIFWIRNLYTDMTAFNVELTEIETYNWLRIKMENNDQNLMEFLSVYPHKLHVSHFNLLLPSTETRLVICQMEKAKLLPDRTSVIHLLHHYGHQNDLNSVLNIIFFTLYDLRINIDAQLIEAFIDALINSDEPKLAMYLLIQICSAYDEQTLPPAISLSESQVAVLDYLVSNFVNLEHAQLQQSIRPTAQMLRPFLKYYRSAREKDTLSALIQLVDKYDIEL